MANKSGVSVQLAMTGLVMAISGSVLADQVFNDDLIISGSQCLGMDCINGENFSYDTLRLKENNLRIKFDDTSSTGSFPSNDWQITANDSSNGGANKFSIDDVTSGLTPFTIEAGAPSHSLFVSSDGELGIGTSTPELDLQIKSGDTPSIRLEQDSSIGYAAQKWDIGANESNFFVRDITAHVRPFVIKPGAPENSLHINANGYSGINNSNPEAYLHIKDATVAAQTTADSVTALRVENSAASEAERTLLALENQGNTALSLKDSSADGSEWRLVNSEGSFVLMRDGAEMVTIKSDGDVCTADNICLRNLASRLSALDGQ